MEDKEQMIIKEDSVYIDGHGMLVTVVRNMNFQADQYPWKGKENGRSYTMCGRAWVDERRFDDEQVLESLVQKVY